MCGFRILGNQDDLGALEPALLENGQHRALEQEALTEDEDWCGNREPHDRTTRQLLADLQRKADAEQEENNAAPDEQDRPNLRANRQQAIRSVEALELHQRRR